MYSVSKKPRYLEVYVLNVCTYIQLQASNEDGTSPWSDVVQYRTLCDRPRPPSKPQTKGKLYPDSFRVVWGLYSYVSLIILFLSLFLSLHRICRVATRPVFAGTSRFSACLSRVPVERLLGRYMSRFLSILNKLNKKRTKVQFLIDKSHCNHAM